jgi:hypothetical protein
MTLFAAVPPRHSGIFCLALGQWCEGRMDERTLTILSSPVNKT